MTSVNSKTNYIDPKETKAMPSEIGIIIKKGNSPPPMLFGSTKKPSYLSTACQQDSAWGLRLSLFWAYFKMCKGFHQAPCPCLEGSHSGILC